jgi:Tol biopolymer transport system component
MSLSQRRGPEMSAFTDSATGRTIQRLTNSQMEDKHTYYDISPWSADGRLLAFSSAHPDDLKSAHRDSWATDRGEVYLMDTETFELRRIADDGFYITHTGTGAMWHPSGEKIYYYSAPNEVSVVNVQSGRKEHVMSGGIRQLSPDGAKFAWTVNDPSPSYPQRGVYTMSEDGSEAQLIVPTDALYKLTPNRDCFALEQMTVGNTKWTPDGRHMLVAMWVKSAPGDITPWNSKPRRSIYIVSRDGSERRWLTFFGHHHSWTANGTQVLYSGYMEHSDDGVRKVPRLYLIDSDGSNKRIVVDQPLGGHPIASPDGSLITTWDDEGVILVDVAKQKVEYLAMLQPSFDMTHYGTHPHCIWRQDGGAILYNSAQSGHSQLYQIVV